MRPAPKGMPMKKPKEHLPAGGVSPAAECYSTTRSSMLQADDSTRRGAEIIGLWNTQSGVSTLIENFRASKIALTQNLPDDPHVRRAILKHGVARVIVEFETSLSQIM